MNKKEKKIIALIPTRLDSTRLFAKSLLEIDGLPLVVHTYKRAMLSKLIDNIFSMSELMDIAMLLISGFT